MRFIDEPPPPRHGSPAPAAPGRSAEGARPLRPAGHVTLVGAGPGDPELLTLKAARALREARLVLYDHLVGDGILALLPADAQRIYVGKESARHALPQDQICALMLRLARQGHDVLRLKGGDGFVFGRGGEEAQALAAAGIGFEVIPGITAAQGAAASVGIPLTHRDHAGALVYATGHLRADREGDAAGAGGLDWELLARPRQTVVIYMGVAQLERICAELIAHGRGAEVPAAMVEQASLPGERCIVGTLATLPALAREHQVRAPALIIVGEVVGVRAELAPWLQAPRGATQASAEAASPALLACAA